ncbi:tudor domain-containing protein 5 [Eurytemora carolleeae]|uniref:tudor domain-containing protein 5 n=1 Tax=Eurytemora carolleeae TaxID=1294199 RepID=UPI000C772A8B|nr:tudor domain-containing protein 5 [Eurytemora carolleeae]|eukprot:XP_023341054.1 tudor domain-containing protein 5-like [Eurytemora affinis]
MSENNELDLLTFTRCMKTFAVHSNGIQENMFADQYRKINLAQFGVPVHFCIEALNTQGYITKIMSHISTDLVPTKKAFHFIDKINSQCSLAYEVEPGIKHQELYYSSSKCAGDQRRIPVLTVPPAVKNLGTAPILVQDIVDPKKVWFQLKDAKHTGALDDMMVEIKMFYNTSSFSREQYSIEHMDDIESGDIIAAPYGASDYYRAMVKKKMGALIKVFFVDYGNEEQVELSQLYYLKSEFLKLPGQAICGCIRLKSKGYLTPDEVGRFQSLQEIRAVFSTKFENDFWPVKPVQIEIIDEGSQKTLKDILGDLH